MNRFAAATIVALAVLLSACSSTPPAVEESPVVTDKKRKSTQPAPPARPEFHIVGRGETLYAIAFRYGLDFRGLARANGISEPYTIYPGQKLRLADKVVAKKPAKKSVVKPADTASKSAGSKPQPATQPAPAATPAAGTAAAPAALPHGRGWLWPVDGKVLARFDAASVGPKGIALAGNAGDAVRAARGGRVVYTGSSLVGYGQLVIIKHDDVYLSAYAHNSKLLVKEGEQVKAGQVIAEMGSSGTDRTQLHFEVRRNGDPIDPLQVLPKR
ncbi:MAG: peptidoglycan DD-metalloendopeptidase family protein [Gammaproteobacteria bacterium]